MIPSNYKGKPIKVELIDAVNFAILNLEEIAIPLADKHNVNSSMDSATKRLKQALQAFID